MQDRSKYEITFPRVEGYRYEINERKLAAKFTDDSRTVIENEPTEVRSRGAIGEEAVESMDMIRSDARVSYYPTCGRVASGYYKDADGEPKYWLYPQLHKIVEQYVKNWIAQRPHGHRISQCPNTSQAHLQRFQAIVKRTSNNLA